MSARIRYPGRPGIQIPVVIEQLATASFWTGAGFGAVPAVIAVPESALKGRYMLDLATLAATWPNGQYAVWVVTLDKSGAIICVDDRYGIASFTLNNGDDAPLGPAVLNIAVPPGTIVNAKAV